METIYLSWNDSNNSVMKSKKKSRLRHVIKRREEIDKFVVVFEFINQLNEKNIYCIKCRKYSKIIKVKNISHIFDKTVLLFTSWTVCYYFG